METSQSIWTTNQLTGFYMRATFAFNGLTSTYPKIIENQRLTKGGINGGAINDK